MKLNLDFDKFIPYIQKHPNTVVGGSIFIGLLSYPLIVKISRLCVRIVINFSDWLNRKTPIIRLRSFNCNQCAQQHLSHMNGQHFQLGVMAANFHANLGNAVQKPPVILDPLHIPSNHAINIIPSIQTIPQPLINTSAVKQTFIVKPIKKQDVVPLVQKMVLVAANAPSEIAPAVIAQKNNLVVEEDADKALIEDPVIVDKPIVVLENDLDKNKMHPAALIANNVASKILVDAHVIDD